LHPIRGIDVALVTVAWIVLGNASVSMGV